MFYFSSLRIGAKLAITSAIGIILVLTMAGSQYYNGNEIKRTSDLSGDRQTVTYLAASAKAEARALIIGFRSIRFAANAGEIKTAQEAMRLSFAEFNKYVDQMIAKSILPASRERMEKLKATGANYMQFAQQLTPAMIEAVALGSKAVAADPTSAETARLVGLKGEIAKTVQDRGVPLVAELNKSIDDTIENSLKRAAEFNAVAENTMATSVFISLGLSALTVLVLLGTAVFGARSIARPLNALVAPLEEVASGNFAITVPGISRKDEIGQIANAVQIMAHKVSATIGEIKASGREVTNASAEISTSTTDLSQRTEEQAASLEETSAAMEELSATVKKNAESAQMANTDANQTREVADRGGKVVAQAVEAMAKIEESSRKISDIIGVIDEIARQTNLLALNAAVEAARAGEAGRGFAVVASEVRSLAQRSSQAAKDIKDLITNSNGQVKDGVELVNKAGESLTEIVESIKKVAAVVSDIANASIEQATGIEQINKALTQMDEVTQQNSALVEENAATAKTLEHQAKAMDEQVAYFQIGNGSDHRAPSPAQSRAPMERPAPRQVAAPPSRGPAAPKRPMAAPKRATASAAAASGGGARRMQTALATAVNADADWKEF